MIPDDNHCPGCESGDCPGFSPSTGDDRLDVNRLARALHASDIGCEEWVRCHGDDRVTTSMHRPDAVNVDREYAALSTGAPDTEDRRGR